MIAAKTGPLNCSAERNINWDLAWYYYASSLSILGTFM